MCTLATACVRHVCAGVSIHHLVAVLRIQQNQPEVAAHFGPCFVLVRPKFGFYVKSAFSGPRTAYFLVIRQVTGRLELIASDLG